MSDREEVAADQEVPSEEEEKEGEGQVEVEEEEDKVEVEEAGSIQGKGEKGQDKEEEKEDEDTGHTDLTGEDRTSNASEEPKEPMPMDGIAAPSKRHTDAHVDAPTKKSTKISPKETAIMSGEEKPTTAATTKRHADSVADASPRKSTKSLDGSGSPLQSRSVARPLIGVSGAIETAEAQVIMGQQHAKNMVDELAKLVSLSDFAGAAELQKKMAKSPVIEETYQARLDLLVAQSDYAGAAKLQEQQKALQKQKPHIQAEEEAHDAEIQRLVSLHDYAGAAKIQSQKKKPTDNQHLRNPANEIQEQALRRARASRSAATKAERALEARCLVYQKEIARMVDSQDYAAAAVYDQEKKAMTEELQTQTQLAIEHEAIVASMGLSLPTSDARHAAAPIGLADRPESTTQAEHSVSEQAQIRTPLRNCTTVTVAQLLDTSAPLPADIRLESVRILSYTKITSVPAQKGKNKGKGKGNIKGKNKGKDGNVGKTDNGRQDAKIAYIGQDKKVMALATFGVDIHHLLDDFMGCLVNVQGLRPRPGQMGTLYWNTNTSIVKSPESNIIADQFEYDTAATNKDLATINHMQQYNKGDMVALVIRPQSVEEQFTSNNEGYLVVHGFDMECTATGPMRFWRHEIGDIIEGKIYIVRGLKVVDQTYWSEDQYKYIPKEDGSKTVEISFRTALEDVSEVSDIAQYFK